MKLLLIIGCCLALGGCAESAGFRILIEGHENISTCPCQPSSFWTTPRKECD